VSIDVDTASYTNVRRFLNQGQLPAADAVRIEEMLNYFAYAYPDPTGDDPFSVTTEVALCPWAPTHRLLRLGLKSKPIETRDLPPAHLTFLIDVSGSMRDPAKLPVKEAGT
jgi:Ca-activated chloride channel family protein